METQTQTPDAAKLVKPPTGQTKMVAPSKSSKNVRVTVMRPFMIALEGGKEGETRMTTAGEVLTVPVAVAKDLTKEMKGAYSFAGERYVADGSVVHHDLRRARLATESDLKPAAESALDTLDEE